MYVLESPGTLQVLTESPKPSAGGGGSGRSVTSGRIASSGSTKGRKNGSRNATLQHSSYDPNSTIQTHQHSRLNIRESFAGLGTISEYLGAGGLI